MRKRVLFVGPLPPPYHGITISTQRLLASELGKEFELLHFDTSDHREMDNIGKLDPWNFYFAFKHLVLFGWACFTWKPDLVYTTINSNIAYARDGLFILLGRWVARRPVVVHLRGAYFGSFYRQSAWWVRKFVDITLSRASRVIVLGESLRPLFAPWFTGERMDVVPNGTPFRPLPERIDRQARSGPVRIAFLGNLIEEKGVLDLLTAFAEVARKAPDCECHFAGAWWDYDAAESKFSDFLRQHGLEGRVFVHGVLKGRDKDEFLIAADVFCFPTYYTYEGHPNVIVEAMAAGLPVVSTDFVAIPETVLDGETGFIVPVRRPDRVAERLYELVADRSLRLRMGAASRSRYEREYTQERNVELMAESFRRALRSAKD